MTRCAKATEPSTTSRAKLLPLWPILGGGVGVLVLLARGELQGYSLPLGIIGGLVSLGLYVFEWTQTLRCQQLRMVGTELERRLLAIPDDRGSTAGDASPGLDYRERLRGQFLSLPSGFRPQQSLDDVRLKKLLENDGRFAYRLIRHSVDSFSVYVPIIVGWFGVAVSELLS
jgi:hypothetical protein